MELKDKYGFNKEWFINTYNKINHPIKVNNLDNKFKEKFESLYRIHYLNFDGFLDDILLSINDIQSKNDYLKEETKCIKCKCYYPYNLDSFIFIMLKVEGKNDDYTDITYKLCYNCIRNLNIFKCKKCNNNNIEPYCQVYLQNMNDQYTCKKCHIK